MNKSTLVTKNNIDIQATGNKKYKASFRWVTPKDKEEFKNSQILVPISVGQKYHEDGEFEATIKLINKSFKECTILIADTLRRHSLDAHLHSPDSQELLEITIGKGDEWLKRNTKYIEMLSIPYKISRWNEWLSKEEYNLYRDLVYGLYKASSSYKNIVHDIVHNFLLREDRRNDSRWVDGCIAYVLEESIVTCLWVKDGFNFNVYPSGDNQAMIEAYERLIKPLGYKYRSLSLNIKKIHT